MKTTSSKEFSLYGKKLDGDFSEVINYLLKSTPIPSEGNIYVRDDEKFRELPSFSRIRTDIFGEQDIECGYCNGNNTKLNCLEYHNCPEVNFAATDLILLLALQSDVENKCISSSKVVPFLIKKGEGIVLYPQVMHFSPCKSEGLAFKCAVILTAGTNMDLVDPHHDQLLFKNNKWLYAHQESKQAKMGAYVGLIGENIEIKC